MLGARFFQQTVIASHKPSIPVPQFSEKEKKAEPARTSRSKESFERVPFVTAALTHLGFYILMLMGFINQLFFTPKVAKEYNREVKLRSSPWLIYSPLFRTTAEETFRPRSLDGQSPVLAVEISPNVNDCSSTLFFGNRKVRSENFTRLKTRITGHKLHSVFQNQTCGLFAL